MDILKPKAVIGTNSWGGSFYEKAFRGSVVPEETLIQAMDTAQEMDIPIYDLARDYGLGKAEKMIGKFGTGNIIVSAKYTPFKHYKKGCVRKSFEKDLRDFKRDYIDIYWLHLPTDIEQHLQEIIEIYKEGKIRYIGVSNFNLEECKRSKEILEKAGIKLYGVQNHYSIVCRDWETNGLLDWCNENDVSFWAWAVLEEGMLRDPRKPKKKAIMSKIYKKQVKKLEPLLNDMTVIADEKGITVSQLAMAFVRNKGIVPICGCRRPEQVKQLAESADVVLSQEEIEKLQCKADACSVKIMGKDMFRAFVLKEKKHAAKSTGNPKQNPA